MDTLQLMLYVSLFRTNQWRSGFSQAVTLLHCSSNHGQQKLLTFCVFSGSLQMHDEETMDIVNLEIAPYEIDNR